MDPFLIHLKIPSSSDPAHIKYDLLQADITDSFVVFTETKWDCAFLQICARIFNVFSLFSNLPILRELACVGKPFSD